MASGLYSPRTNCSGDFLALQKPSMCKALEKSSFIFKGVCGDPAPLKMRHFNYVVSEHMLLRESPCFYSLDMQMITVGVSGTGQFSHSLRYVMCR